MNGNFAWGRIGVSIAVIGGGLAGLSAAYGLERGGLEAVVFESEPVIGGRAVSGDYGGYPLNFGAQYFAGDRNPAIDLAHEIGLQLDSLDEPRIAVFLKGELTVADTAAGFFLKSRLGWRARLSLARVGMRMERVRAMLLGPSGNERAKELDQVPFSTFLAGAHPDVQDLFRSIAVRMACCEPDQLSASFGLSWIPGVVRPRIPGAPGFHRIFSVRGGTGELTNHLGEMLGSPPQVNKTATNIFSDGGVRVEFEDGSTWRGAGAIVTTPGPVTARIADFLPAEERRRLSMMEYGSYVLVTLAFEQAPASPWDRVYAVQIVGHPFHVAVNETWSLQESGARVDATIIKMVAGGQFAREIMQEPDAVLQSWAHEKLKEICPDLNAQPKGAWVRRWPFGLPIWGPGRRGAGRPPVDFGVVQIAGDHVDIPNTQGAVKSGLSAAFRLMSNLGAQPVNSDSLLLKG